MTNFEFASIVREMNSATQVNEYTAAWAAPEILKGVGIITREADAFAFGMVMIEVCLHALSHLASGMEG